MLSAIQLEKSNIVESQGSIGKAAPETGEFDFMSYLLGLQASPTETDELNNSVLAQEKRKEQTNADPSAVALSALFPTAMQSPIAAGIPVDEKATGAELPKEIATYQSDSRETKRSDVASQPSPIVAQATGTELGNARTVGAATKEVAFGRYAQNERMQVGVYGADSAGKSERDTQSLSSPEVSLVNHPHFARVADLDHVRRRDSQDSPFNVLSTQVDGPFGLAKTEETQSHSAATVTRDDAVPMSDLFNRVETLANAGGGTMVVTLDPPDLGRVEIQVTARGKRVQVEMTSDNDFTKNLIESHFDELRTSIQDQDLTLSKLEVRTDRDGLNFNMGQFAQNGNQESQQSQDGESNQQDRAGRFSSSRGRQVEMPVVNRALMGANVAIGSGRVDVRI